jgi:Tfp pilus assembly PilM family ATPase
LRIGPRRYELVVLDGGPKKHRIAAFQSGELPQGEESLQEAAALLREAAKRSSVPPDNIGLVIDTGLAAFRTVKLPFGEQGKVEQVIKYEVESQLPHWNIDEVVVDHIATQTHAGETTFLTTSVQKKAVQGLLSLCRKAGIEPQEVELEATAMANAALAAEVCLPDEAQVLVHIGDLTTCVVVVDGKDVRSIRAIHIGALSHERLPPADPGGAEEEGEEAAEKEEPSPSLLQEQLEQTLSRLRRELVRTVTGTQTHNPIKAIYVCGLELPGLVGSSVLEVPVYLLDVFEEASGQPAEGTAPLVVAYGAAIRQLGGGVLKASLRREELRFTGKFERIELPLAMASVLLVTLLAVFNVFERQLWLMRDTDVTSWRNSAIVYMLGDPRQGRPGNLEVPSDAIKKYVRDIQEGNDTQRSTLEQLQEINWRLEQEIRTIEKELGKGKEGLKQPQSALEGLALVLEVMQKMEDDLGRIALRKVESNYQFGRGGKEDSVLVLMDLTFFAADDIEATANYQRLKSLLEEKPWVKEVKIPGSNPLEGGGGIAVDRMTVFLDLEKVDRTRAAPVPESAADSPQDPAVDTVAESMEKT